MKRIDRLEIVSGQVVILMVENISYRMKMEAWIGKNFNKGYELNQKDYQFVLTENLKWLVRDYGLRQLAISQKSKVELEKKMSQKVRDWLSKNKIEADEVKIDEIITETTDFLEEKRFIDDTKFIQSFVRKSGKKSNRQIEYELRTKGVDINLVKSILRDRQEDEAGAIQKLLDKKMKKGGKMGFVEKNKLISGLIRKGFPLDLVKNLIDERFQKK